MEQEKQYMQNSESAVADTTGNLSAFHSMKSKFITMTLHIKTHPKESALQLLTFVFICLWIYVGSKKVFTYADYRSSMIKQPFDDQYEIVLSYILPVAELAIGMLFIFERTKTLGLWLTILLMLIFSVYVTLALLNIWGSIPCDCILEFTISWKAHLWINGIITLASIAGLLLNKNIKGYRKMKPSPVQAFKRD